MLKKINSKTIIIALFILISMAFALPSVIYLVQNGTIYGFGSAFKILMTENVSRLMQTVVFLMLFVSITIIYFIIIKKNKEIFKNIKQILIMVASTTILFAFVLPFSSSDVFYYIGVGWLDSNYGQNPYYVSMNEYMEKNVEAEKDKILIKGADYWGDQTVVYGPIWAMFCKVFAGMSFGSVDKGLLVFKVAVMLVHLANTYLIYKISRKKVLSVIYGLNPFILLEGIANVHNDIYVVFFVLASLYFLLRKKNLFLSVIILAISAAVKYVTILLLPFIIIYYFRKEKKLSARFLNCIKYGLVFILFIGATYLVYVQNLDVLGGIIDQQGKYTKSLQTMLIFHGYTDLEMLQKGLMLMFFVICIMMGMNSITKKYISFSFAIKQYNILLCLLLPLIITNFEPWYLMWLFPTMMLQSGKAVKQAIGISLTSQVANCMFMLHGEDWHYTDQFVIIMITGIIITLILTSNKMKKEES